MLARTSSPNRWELFTFTACPFCDTSASASPSSVLLFSSVHSFRQPSATRKRLSTHFFAARIADASPLCAARRTRSLENYKVFVVTGQVTDLRRRRHRSMQSLLTISRRSLLLVDQNLSPPSVTHRRHVVALLHDPSNKVQLSSCLAEAAALLPQTASRTVRHSLGMYQTLHAWKVKILFRNWMFAVALAPSLPSDAHCAPY